MNESESVSEVPRAELFAQDFEREQSGYQQVLRPRQIQMIAIAGAIGSGLFLGAGGRLASAGPSLFVAYAVAGLMVYMVMRALGELVVYRPSSGSFISYAREFLGEKAAFIAGWMNFVFWATVAIVDVTAVALYVQFWKAFTAIPQWVLALIALVAILGINLVSVRLFGELEFWFSFIKVGAILAFLVIGSVALGFGWPLESGGKVVTPSILTWSDHGGIFPNGMIATVLVLQGAIFAYGGTELIGTAAGETKDPHTVIPKAVNSVVWRIGVFYIATLVLLSLLLPYSMYKANESPFVTFFASLGGQQAGEIAGSVMNFVVITAALSAMNAGLYSTGRSLRSMALNGAAPSFTGRLSRTGVPYMGILVTSCVALIGVAINYFVPAKAFDIVMNMSTLGILSTWGTIVLCQIALYRRATAGLAERPGYRMPGAPYTGYLTLGGLAVALVLIALDYPVGTYTVGTFVVVGVPALIAGWFVARKHIGVPRQ
ncbi:amino acid permease [Tsukamurella ocularis]|uniref:amino acid permease n=1 Tax=Tsukamurella ocularis TaxID=1970234 RepID=UPI002166EF0D|nr:amino acid permease [Tsukamurella ocularis]MCS3778577.1 L-asparagine permease [Tsukamurella ocularis]MCS3789278.1 L-asparagine permease [Tsukamurella ocularis]MCS3853128.1 L-asparagine permease [Tsukamurella ocularis]